MTSCRVMGAEHLRREHNGVFVEHEAVNFPECSDVAVHLEV